VFKTDFEKWYEDEILPRVKCDVSESFKRILMSIFNEQYKTKE